MFIDSLQQSAPDHFCSAGNQSCCQDEWDAETKVLWNSTKAGLTASLACSLFSPFATSENLVVLRECDQNATWLEADYSQCLSALRKELSHGILVSRVLSGAYILGGGLSMVLLSIALFIFCFFKNLHCNRIWIHCNLVIAFIMRHVFLLIRLRNIFPFIVMTNQMHDQLVDLQLLQMTSSESTYYLQTSSELEQEQQNFQSSQLPFSDADHPLQSSNFSSDNRNITTELPSDWWTDLVCRADILVDWFTFLCTFFWMFVEAAYLYSKIYVSVFDGDNDTLFKRFCILGWGGPVVLVSLSAVVLQFGYQVACWEGVASTDFGWLLYGPSLAMLVANVYFMIAIIAVLVTKMKGSKTAETEQIRVAFRAIVFLVPLFGLTFLVMLVPMSPGIMDFYRIFNAVLQSLQGAAVAFIYCFINQEVHYVIKTRWNRFSGARVRVEARYTNPPVHL